MESISRRITVRSPKNRYELGDDHHVRSERLRSAARSRGHLWIIFRVAVPGLQTSSIAPTTGVDVAFAPRASVNGYRVRVPAAFILISQQLGIRDLAGDRRAVAGILMALGSGHSARRQQCDNGSSRSWTAAAAYSAAVRMPAGSRSENSSMIPDTTPGCPLSQNGANRDAQIADTP